MLLLLLPTCRAQFYTQQGVQQVGDMLHVMLNQEEHYEPQDASAFSRMLCASKSLGSILMRESKQCIRADLQLVVLPDKDPARPDNMLAWMQRQLKYGTLRSLKVDCCHDTNRCQGCPDPECSSRGSSEFVCCRQLEVCR